jgi:hypothetical protein
MEQAGHVITIIFHRDFYITTYYAIMVTKKSRKVAMKYYCKCCDYGTSKPCDYNKHLLTAKHNMVINGNEKSRVNGPYMCVCGKEYMNSSGLSRHKRKCDYDPNIVEEDAKEDIVDTGSTGGCGENVDYNNILSGFPN